MILTTGKRKGFVIEGTRTELRMASNLPGASFRRKEGVVRLPENLASWKALRDYEFDIVDDSAEDKLEALKTSYREHRRKIKNAERKFKLTGETDIPVPLTTVPFEHQVRAFGFCSALDSAALLMDQGTGKTLVAIAIMMWRAREQGITRLLIVCPKAVKPVWPKEFAKHTDANPVYGIDKPPEGEGDFQVWITNYDRLKREQKRIAKWKPEMMILDESHRVKNKKAARTKAAIFIGSKVKYKLILSGTAIGKCITEIWSQFKFLHNSIFGTNYTQFKERYLKMGGYMGYKVVGYQNYEEFVDKMHSISFRVTKDECLDLPPVTYQHLYIPPDARTKKFYKQMEEKLYFEIDEDEVSVDREATKQMKLRQMSGGTVKSDEGDILHISNQKLATLKEFMEERVDDKTVIFFSFTQEIVLAEKMCKELGIKSLTLQGSTPDSEREVFEDRFQEDKSIGAALIQIATGAEGMTLHAANVAIFYSPAFSYIGYSQAKDRINRIGQLRKMTILFLIMEKTVDERVVSVLECNRQLTDDIFEKRRNYTIGDKTMAKEVKGIKASQVAGDLGISAADLRKHLRALKIEKPEAGWVWPNKTAANAVIKQVKARIADLAKAPAKADKPAKEKASSKKTPAKEKKAAKSSNKKAKKAADKE